MAVVKNISTEAGREFWAHVEGIASQVAQDRMLHICEAPWQSSRTYRQKPDASSGPMWKASPPRLPKTACSIFVRHHGSRQEHIDRSRTRVLGPCGRHRLPGCPRPHAPYL